MQDSKRVRVASVGLGRLNNLRRGFQRMKLITTCAAIAGLLLATGWETAADDAGAASTAPNLTKFFAQPVRVQLGNVEKLSGTADFEDSAGNLSALVLQFVNPDGGEDEPISIPVTGLGGVTAGQIALPEGELEPAEAGIFLLRAWLMDADNQQSNVRTVEIEVVTRRRARVDWTARSARRASSVTTSGRSSVTTSPTTASRLRSARRLRTPRRSCRAASPAWSI
jgi:hypothetical protein